MDNLQNIPRDEELRLRQEAQQDVGGHDEIQRYGDRERQKSLPLMRYLLYTCIPRR